MATQLPPLPILLGNLVSPYTNQQQAKAIIRILVSDNQLTTSVIELANKNMLTAALYHQLNQYKLINELDTELKEYLLVMADFINKRNEKLKEQVEEIIPILNKENITPLLLKGSNTLFSEVYPYNSRYMIDLDLLIPNNEAKKARKALRKIGYYTPETYKKQAQFEHHHLPPIFKEGTDATVELHHTSLKNIYSHILDNKEATSSAYAIPHFNKIKQSALSLSPENQILHCFAHSELSSENYRALTLDIRQLEYFVRLIHHLEKTSINWRKIMEIITKHNIEQEFFLYLYKANQLFNLKIPNELFSYSKEIEQQKKKFQHSLRSCNNKGHTLWRLHRSILDIHRRTLSKSALVSSYGEAAQSRIWRYRAKHIVQLSKKYNRPSKIVERIKISLYKYL